jgi:hypothetical protein
MDLLKSVSNDLHVWIRDILGDLQQRIKKLRIEEDFRPGDISEATVRKEEVVKSIGGPT